MDTKKRVTDKDIVSVYEKKACSISATCHALNISRQTFYVRRSKNKKLDEELSEIEESLIDFSESKLLEQINEGNLTAIIFHLKTKGKSRGYIERVENVVEATHSCKNLSRKDMHELIEKLNSE